MLHTFLPAGLAAIQIMSNATRKIVRGLHALDDPKCWDVDIRPPYFDDYAYQKRVDQIAGLNADGKSIIRLIWGPRSIGLYGVPRYWIARKKDGEGFLYTTIKRFYLEQRVERAQYFDSWNVARYGTVIPADTAEKCEHCGSTDDPVEVYGIRRCASCGSTELVKGEVVDKGEPPQEFYRFAWMCANHEDFDQDAGWEACCERAYKDGRKRCFGTFRSPNDYDLECISAAVKRRDNEPYVDPYAPLSAHDLAAIEMSSGLQTEKMAQAIQQRRSEITANESVLSDRGATAFDYGRNGESRIITP